MFAAGEGNTAAAELLLEFRAKLNARSAGGYTPLLFAVRNDRYDTVKFLLAQGADVNDRIPDGTSALSMAILNADFDLAALLLEAGADPNVPDPRGHPLHVVAWLHQPGAPPDFAMNGEDPEPVPQRRGKLSTSTWPGCCWPKAPIRTPRSPGASPASAAAAWRAARPT